MSLATAQRNDNLDVRFYKQTAYGEDPASTALQSLRLKKFVPKPNKITVESGVMGQRQVEDIFKVGEDFSLSLLGELAHAEWEWAFEAVLASTFVTFTLTATDISFAASDSSINSVANGFSSSIVAGQWIKVVNSPLNSGYWYVSSKTSTGKLILSNGLTTAGATIAVQDEAASASVTVSAKHLRQGTTLNSYTFERKNTDNSTYDVWNSFVADSVKVTFKGEAIIEIEIQGIGKVADLNNSASFGSSVTAASSNAPFNATNNFLRIKEGSTVITDEMIAASVMVKCNASHRRSLGNSTPTGALQKTVEVSGDLEFYFKDNARRQIFQDHTSGTLFYIVKNSAGVFILTLPKLYYQDLNNGAEGKDQDTLEKYQIRGAKNQTYLQTITVDVLS